MLTIKIANKQTNKQMLLLLVVTREKSSFSEHAYISQHLNYNGISGHD